jgi:hypothetical protein
MKYRSMSDCKDRLGDGAKRSDGRLTLIRIGAVGGDW